MLTPQSIEKMLLELLGEGEAMVSITHDRPPAGSWFIEVTDYWTGMITRQFSGVSLWGALKAAVDKKTKQEKLSVKTVQQRADINEEIPFTEDTE